jgi:polysaccharide export outer membrane protein
MKLRIITQVGLAAFFVTIGPSWAQDRPLEVTDSLPSQAVTQKVQTSDKEPAVKPLSRERHPRYRVRSGDEFEIAFTFTPEFNQAVTIQPDGYITLREIGDIYVQGQTVPELIKTIRTAYEEILRDPAVSITLTNVEMPYFIAAGWLRSPGKYDLRGRTTVAEAVNIAGGFTDESKHSEVYLFRYEDDTWVTIAKINVKEMLAKADLSEDFRLQPGDFVYVPQNTFSKIKGFIIPKVSVGPRIPTR